MLLPGHYFAAQVVASAAAIHPDDNAARNSLYWLHVERFPDQVGDVCNCPCGAWDLGSTHPGLWTAADAIVPKVWVNAIVGAHMISNNYALRCAAMMIHVICVILMVDLVPTAKANFCAQVRPCPEGENNSPGEFDGYRPPSTHCFLHLKHFSSLWLWSAWNVWGFLESRFMRMTCRLWSMVPHWPTNIYASVCIKITNGGCTSPKGQKGATVFVIVRVQMCVMQLMKCK